ncbi:MAG TPA: hypothetical protein VH540_04530 [Ktedonobacterales bacterium]|jgi:hypothetical protein
MNESDHVDPLLLQDESTTLRRRFLPHLERVGAIYFVTFRLTDALPEQVLADFRAEREALLAKARASRWLTEKEQARLDMLVSRRVQQYLDAGKGACHLAHPQLAGTLAETMRRFDGAKYRLLA